MRAFLVLVVLCGCAEPLAVEPDAGEVDSGHAAKDAGPPPQVDAGHGVDAGELDAGQPDAGGGAIATTMRWQRIKTQGECRPGVATNDVVETCEAFAYFSVDQLVGYDAGFPCPWSTDGVSALIDCTMNCKDMGVFCAAANTGRVNYTCTEIADTSGCTWNP